MRTRHIFFIVAVLSLTISSTFLTSNAAPNPIEIISISEVSSTSVEILFSSSVPKKSLSYFVINAVVESPVGMPKNIKKVIKTKASGLITTEIKNLNPKTSYKFTVSVKTNKAKMINSAAVGYSPLSNLMDALSNLSSDWGNPKPIQLPAAAPAAAPVVLPAFTLTSSTETKSTGSAIIGYTITSTGGTITSYAISPAASAGLTFSTSTGLLSGNPTVAGATAYTITATNATGSATQTFTLTVTVGAASKVAVTQASVGTSPGVAFTTQPQITIQDLGGNTITSSTAVVTATVSAGGTLVGTATATASSGVATFSNLGIRGFGATPYTITYTAAGLTTATQSVTPSALIVGNTGPGGGTIFYVAPLAGFNCGPTLNEKCYYLEAASTTATTNPWTDVPRTWSTGNNQITPVPTATGTAIGTGYKNSLAIVAQSGNVAESSAAVAARAYTGGSKTDWFLPSKDELNQMCKWATGSADLINLTTACTGGTLNSGSAAGFVDDDYWSSTETDAGGAWGQYFEDGEERNFDKNFSNYVRPVRAF